MAERPTPFLVGMRNSRGSTGLVVGLVVGAGVCYWLYRVTSRRRRRKSGGAGKLVAGTKGERLRNDPSLASQSLLSGEYEVAGSESGLLQQASGMSVISSTLLKDSRSLRQGVDLPKPSDNLEVHHIQKLINLLESTEDPSIQEQALVTLSNSAAFSVNQDIIRNVGGISVIGKTLSVPIAKVKEKALNALNNLSMNIKNQEEIKIQVLKVLVNLSANPTMTEHLLNAQAPFLLTLFESCINKEVLLRVLAFATNLAKHMKKEKTAAHQHSEDSVFSVLWGNSTDCAQKLAALLYHHDTEVKEEVAKLIMQQC
ncbi:armadillo repeat-containing protein 10 isoform X2 [Hemicordylus capensis]|uniref:armadillo repeat-containing protein 10 isoform X2 n=1 Tax=Hemicordylus capensis TaxID=884348 RepID=UPI002303CBBB|nr:armadillo repeat-containing protein 10 isoform X2 [Hemicordylus capensis]